MRILSNAPDPRFGGPLQRSLSVARQLRPRGIDTVFLVPQGDDRFVKQARENGFECSRIDQPRIRSPRLIGANARFLTGCAGCVRTAADHIDNYDIDIVHVNGPLNFAVALAAARSDAALVWHFNDTLTPTPLRQLSAALAQRWADEIVVAADAVADYFFDGSTPTTTLYAPVDVDQFDSKTIDVPAESLRAEFDIAPSANVIGAVGNINPAKGHEFLIEAVAQLDSDAHLVLVGQVLDSQRSYYESLQQTIRELGIESRVTFTGWREDIPELLSFFDLFVLASVTEACPIVVLEAMAMECPIVATDVGGVRELLPGAEYGWVVPPENPAAISTAIGDALNSESKPIRTANAKSRVKKVFSLDACVQNHLDIYQSLHSPTDT